MNLIKFRNRYDIILSLPFTVFFNFYYLPFRQAIKLPIILYRPKFFGLSGKIRIESGKVRFGMIHLGRWNTIVLQRKGFWYQNEGGTIIFRGDCQIGAGSVLKVGKSAILDIGNDVTNSVALNIDCQYKIVIKGPARFGWNVIIMDSAMHRTKFMDGTFTGKGYKEIEIGKNNWITTQCIIQAGTKTPDYCIAATNSLLNKDYSEEDTHILIAGSPAKVKKKGVWRDFSDCSIIYEAAMGQNNCMNDPQGPEHIR